MIVHADLRRPRCDIDNSLISTLDKWSTSQIFYEA